VRWRRGCGGRGRGCPTVYLTGDLKRGPGDLQYQVGVVQGPRDVTHPRESKRAGRRRGQLRRWVGGGDGGCGRGWGGVGRAKVTRMLGIIFGAVGGEEGDKGRLQAGWGLGGRRGEQGQGRGKRELGEAGAGARESVKGVDGGGGDSGGNSGRGTERPQAWGAARQEGGTGNGAWGGGEGAEGAGRWGRGAVRQGKPTVWWRASSSRQQLHQGGWWAAGGKERGERGSLGEGGGVGRGGQGRQTILGRGGW